MAMMTDQFTHKVDEKGRVSFPATFRKVFPENLKVIKSLTDNCLMVFSTENYEAWINEMFDQKGGYNPTSKSHIQMKRYLTASTVDVEIDKAGRIGLKAELRSKVGITDTAVLVGADDHVEIWNETAWNQSFEGFDESLVDGFFTD